MSLWSDIHAETAAVRRSTDPRSVRDISLTVTLPELSPAGGTLSDLTLFVFSNHPLTSCHHPNAQAITQLQHAAQDTGDLNPPVEHPVKNGLPFPSILEGPSACNWIKVKLCCITASNKVFLVNPSEKCKKDKMHEVAQYLNCTMWVHWANVCQEQKVHLWEPSVFQQDVKMSPGSMGAEIN